MGRVITTTIFEGWDRIFGRRPAAQEVELEANTTTREPYLELRIKGPDGYYDLSERSLGFRWFFMFLLMTSFHGLDDEGPDVSLPAGRACIESPLDRAGGASEELRDARREM